MKTKIKKITRKKTSKFLSFLKKFSHEHMIAMSLTTGVLVLLVFTGLTHTFKTSVLDSIDINTLPPNSIWTEQDPKTNEILFKFKNGQQSVEKLKIFFSVQNGPIDLNNITTNIPLWEISPQYSEKNNYFYVGITSSINRKLQQGQSITAGETVEIFRISGASLSEKTTINILTEKSYVGERENRILHAVSDKPNRLMAYFQDFGKGLKGDLIASNIDSRIQLNTSYSKDKNGIYYAGKKIEKADVESFEILNDVYGKDKNHVYVGKDKNNVYIGDILTEADSESFELINDYYAKDKNNIYFHKMYYFNGIIENADLSSFQVLNENYAKDKNNAYYRGIKIEKVNLESFEVLSAIYAKDTNNAYYEGTVREGVDLESFEALNKNYAKDKNSIYFLIYKFVNMNPDSFELLNENYTKYKNNIYFYGNKIEKVNIPSFEVLHEDYAKDAKNVYYGETIIEEVDVFSFKVLNETYAKDKDYVYSMPWGKLEGVDLDSFEVFNEKYAKDKNNAYYWETKIEGIDLNSFEVLNENYAKDINNVYYHAKKIIGADPVSFESLIWSVSAKDKNYEYDEGKRTDTSNTTTSNPQKTSLPSAGYKDKVLTSFDTYKNPFPDTNTINIEGKAASELYRRGVIGGFSDGTFGGTKPVNRAEAAKFLLLAKGLDVPDAENNGKFWDVKDGEWYVKFVIKAAKLGIIKGYSDGSFRPADGVRRGEFLKMITETFGLEKNLSHNYSDVSGTWVEEYAGIASKYELFPEKWSELRFGTFMTRDEVAVALYQYLGKKN